MLDNSKLGNSLHPKSDLEKPAAIASTTNCNKAPLLPIFVEKSDSWLKTTIPGTSQNSQDVADINYSQFRSKLIDRKDHNSTFQKGTFIISGTY